MRYIFPNKKSGVTILETVFYIAIFVVLSIAVINAMITMTRSFRETSIYAELMQAGSIMEKITREIKQANSIHTVSTTSLKLNTEDISDTDKTATFALSGTDIAFSEDDIFTGNLNSPDITVTDLSFTSITTATGTGIKITMTVRSNSDHQNRLYDFFDTIVLRGDYE